MNGTQSGKIILDPTCGGRTIWFNKNHPRALYTDIREVAEGVIPKRKNFCVKPDKIMDFRNTDLPDKQFKLIVWDPPHLEKLGETSQMRIKYGCLNAHWEDELSKGFNELWRLLDDYGVLIFKWNERDISLTKILKCFSQEPLFGHTMRSKTRTHWMCFMKFPEENQ